MLFSLFPMDLPGSSIFATAPRPASSASALQPAALPRLHLSAVAPPRRPGQHLRLSAPASNIFPMALRHGAPASNKPHPAEKSTPVWLAIWRIWAGFANSQLRVRPSPHLIIYVRILLCCHIELLLRQTQIFRPICPDCLRHLRISAERGYCLAGAQVLDAR